MPDEGERPGTFAQHFLGRGPRRPARVLRPDTPPAHEAGSAVPQTGSDRAQLGLFRSAASAEDQTSARTAEPIAPSRAPGNEPPRATVTADLPPWTTRETPTLEHDLPVVTQGAEPRVWSVRGLVASIRRRIEAGYVDLWVEGEISNCRPAPSGHIYLTLKDGEARLPVVLFRREAQLLRFRPADGMAVLVRGRLSLYESRGELQLIAERLEPRGAGALQLAFDQLKARLLAEGLFEASRKRPLPPYPRCIGVITSPTGAVIRDIITVIRRRHACLNLLVYPVPVQGEACATAVVRALRWFNANSGQADLLLLARGGGSLEDMAGFNEEAVARAIVASKLPVVSAIGHETDFTIADFVADLRAPTPSAAAEIITASQHRVAERVAALEHSVVRSSRYRLLQARQRFARLSIAHVLARVFDGIARRQQRLDDLRQRLEAVNQRRSDTRERRVEVLTTRLNRQSPRARLAAAVTRQERLRERLDRGSAACIASRRSRLIQAGSRLEALSPVAVLARGYALVYGPEGTLISSSGELRPGQQIRARLAHGAIGAEVTEIHEA